MKRLLVLALVLTAIALPWCACAASHPGDVQSKIDRYMDAVAKTEHFMGSVLVARGDHILVAKGYGMADLKGHVPNTPDTEFRIGSITKQFTAMAILMLQQERKLNVQTGICQYVPECPKDWRPITIEELLTHTSGIPDYLDAVSDKTMRKILSQAWTPTQLVALFKDKPLEFKPGTKFSYSNSGYVLLGYIIERVSGKSYGQFLQQHVFAPLGMRGSSYGNGSPAKSAADGYNYFDGKYEPGPDVNLSSAFSAGGIRSTVQDLYTWDQALAGGKLIPPSVQKQMFTPQVQVDAKLAKVVGGNGPVHYGFGWFIKTEFGNTEYAHEGGLPSFTSLNSWFPKQHLFVIVLDNTGSGHIFEIGKALAAIALGEKYETPTSFEAISLPASELAKFVGTYQMAAPKMFLTITQTGDQLQGQVTGQPTFKLYPASKTHFFLKVVRAQLFFQSNSQGDVTGVVLHQDGQELPGKRLTAAEVAKGKRKPNAIALTPDALQKFVGTYQLAPNFAITITRKGDQLMAQGTGQPAAPIYPESPSEFFAKAVDAKFSFVTNAKGEVTSLVLQQGGHEMPAKKVK